MRVILPMLIASLLAVAGCDTERAKQYALDATTAAALSISVEQDYAAVRDAVAGGGYSEAERAQLRRVDERLRAVRDRIADLAAEHGSVAEVLVGADEVRQLYADARVAYSQAREIVADHIDDLPDADRRMIERWDARAQRLDDAIAGLLTAPDGTDVTPYVRSALTIAAGASKLAVAL